MNTKTASQTKILFICLGNICRSPAAQGIFQQMVDERGVADKFEVDSCGVGDWHVGNLPDSRMRRHGSMRGYVFDHHARQFTRSDFSHFDYIIVMDESNYKTITSMAVNDSDRKKVIRMADYFIKYKGADCVPDPYYGGDKDFEIALDLIEDGCQGILKELGV